jgi:hypothetical protein
MALSESPTVIPNLIVREASVPFIRVFPFFGSPAGSKSPVGFASPDRSGYAFVTRFVVS